MNGLWIIRNIFQDGSAFFPSTCKVDYYRSPSHSWDDKNTELCKMEESREISCVIVKANNHLHQVRTVLHNTFSMSYAVSFCIFPFIGKSVLVGKSIYHQARMSLCIHVMTLRFFVRFSVFHCILGHNFARQLIISNWIMKHVRISVQEWLSNVYSYEWTFISMVMRFQV